MIGDGRSLLAFLPAPVLVGDPEGRAVYVNAAFAARFGDSAEGLSGAPLSAFFEGGAREAVLGAVARVCQHGQRARFRLREGGVPYTAVMAPIAAEGANVGFVLLLNDAPLVEERLLSFLREAQEGLDELARCLDFLLEQTGGRRSARRHVDKALRALERLRRRSDELRALVSRHGSEPEDVGSFDAVRMAQEVVEAIGEEAAQAGVSLTALARAELPLARGDGDRLRDALVREVRERIARAAKGVVITLTVKAVGEGEAASLLISLTEVPPPGWATVEVEEEPPSPALLAAIEAVGGSLATTSDPVAGTTTSLRLPAEP